DFLLGAGGDADALAGLSQAAIVRSARRIRPTPPPLWRRVTDLGRLRCRAACVERDVGFVKEITSPDVPLEPPKGGTPCRPRRSPHRMESRLQPAPKIY